MFGLFRKKTEKSDTVESKMLSPQDKRVYLFDFDRTITILHTGGLAYGNELNPEYIRKNVKKGFADFVRKIVNKGHAVYIASYSDDKNAEVVDEEALSGHGLIKFYMDQVFGPDQIIFTSPQLNEHGEIVSSGNIIANKTQDYKQYHLDAILKRESLDPENQDDMKRLYILEDDEDVVRFFMNKGCTIIVPFSASRSADTAATKTLFTSYMPESFTA
jgi:hypothetical protein